MLLLKKVKLNNWLSHADTTLEFNGDDKILVDGESGSGKSSIFEAVVWTLYGEARTDNRSLIKRDRSEDAKQFTSVQLELDADGTLYRITRTATSAGKQSLDVCTIDAEGNAHVHPISGLKNLEAWIETELTGMSYILFVNSVAYMQGAADNFLMQQASKRKELLLEIVKTGDYTDLYDKARKMLDATNVDKLLASQKITTLESDIAGYEVEIAAASDTEIRIEENESKMATLALNLARVDQALSDIATKQSSLNSLKKTQESLQKTIDDANLSLKHLEALKRDLEGYRTIQMTQSYSEDRIIQVNELIEQLTKRAEDLFKLVSERNKLLMNPAPGPSNAQNLLDAAKIALANISTTDNCPANDKCPHYPNLRNAINYAEADVRKWQDLVEKLTVDKKEWDAKLESTPDRTEESKAIMEERNNLMEERSNLVSTKQAAKSTEEQIHRIESMLTEGPRHQAIIAENSEKLLKAQNEYAEAILSLDVSAQNNLLAQKTNYETQRYMATNELTSLKAVMIGVAKAKEKIVAAKNAIDKERIKLVEYTEKEGKLEAIKAAFGSQGIKTVVIDYILPRLEERVNITLGKLSDFQIRLDTQRPKADGEGVVEGMFITIINDVGEELPYESYSGGEKLRITVAVQEALASLGKQIGFRFFDETIFALDSNTEEKFVRVLCGLIKDFPQVMLVSHLDSVKTLFDKKITVYKHNGNSYVK